MTRASAPAGVTANASLCPAPVVDLRHSPYARLRPVPLGSVSVQDRFWSPRLEMIRTVTLPQQYAQCEATGRIDNFRRAAGKKQMEFQGRYYNDSDVYKWVEAAAYALAGKGEARLRAAVELVVREIADAQAPDGYVNTYFTFEREPERWTDLTRMHEMYCAGHLIQAAIACHRATGQRVLLDVAIRLADHICRTFNPQARRGTDGHEEIELALVELYRETGDRRYLDEARFLLDQRGQQPPVLSGLPYHQDHLPVRQQRDIVGHAVRATYLAIGMADVYAETGDPALREAVEALWESAFLRKAYVTGGLGTRWEGESFGADYELPNERAYAETCAAIGGFLWNWRMLGLTGEAKYADWMETALYNGILAGLSLDGRKYFYQNPLADRGQHRRQPWFGTACCPPNIARLLLSLRGYLYSTSDAALWVHHYIAGAVETALPNGTTMALTVETTYPWDETVRLTIGERTTNDDTNSAVTVHLRVPGWSRHARVTVNGEPVAGVTPTAGTYLALNRVWRTGDVIDLHLPMPVRPMASHPHVLANTGRWALTRGPLVYCVEGADHPDTDVYDLVLRAGATYTVEWCPALLGGVSIIRTGEAIVAAPRVGQLYQPVRASAPTQPTPRTGSGTTLTAIPYYAWANRAPGPMLVWLRTEPA